MAEARAHCVFERDRVAAIAHAVEHPAHARGVARSRQPRVGIAPGHEDGAERRDERDALADVHGEAVGPPIAGMSQEHDVVSGGSRDRDLEADARREVPGRLAREVDRGVVLEGRAAEGHHRRTQPVGAVARVAVEVARVGEHPEQTVRGRDADVEALGQLGEGELLHGGRPGS
jgi:hypothetical protein